MRYATSRRRAWDAFVASLALIAITSNGVGAASKGVEVQASNEIGRSLSSFQLRKRTVPDVFAADRHHHKDDGDDHHHRHSKHPPGDEERHCDPLPLELPPHELCSHIHANCPSNGRFDYLAFYYCSTIPPDKGSGNDGKGKAPEQHRYLTAGATVRRILAMTILIGWLIFLFSCLGLVASDFFCPNLGTLASRLGLNESTAGVTFLALGNGSPDVFSTFSAMSTGSGALAIGELIGAASFIVSIVAGSMMLIKPFKVNPYPFCRDVGFFTVAVAMTMGFLIDGHLTLTECLGLVGLYLLYAAVVIVGSLLEERRKRQRLTWERSRGDYLNAGSASERPLGDSLDNPQTEEGPTPASTAASTERNRHLSLPGDAGDPEADPFEVWASQQAKSPQARKPASVRSAHSSHSHTPAGSPLLSPNIRSGLPSTHRLVRSTSKLRNTSGHIPRHSLLGAVEFRDVVRSLALQGQLNANANDEAKATAVAVAVSRDPEAFLHQPEHEQERGHEQGDSAGHRRRHSRSNGHLTRSADSASSSTISHKRPEAVRGHTAPNVGAGSSLAPMVGFDDPWKEHTANDGCDSSPKASSLSDARIDSLPALPRPAFPVVRNNSQEAPNHPTLPRLVIPEGDQESNTSPTPTRPPAAAPSDVTTGGHGGANSRGHYQPSEPRLFTSLRRILLPSLRHWKSKSILGKILSIVNAPPLLVLNLTLPVVDDEAEARAAAHAIGGAGDEGGLRLKGDESPLYAHEPDDASNTAISRDQSDSILDLATGERISVDPEDLPETGNEAAWKTASQKQTASNKRRDLEVASALRRLPAQASSPLSFGSVSPARKQSQRADDAFFADRDAENDDEEAPPLNDAAQRIDDDGTSSQASRESHSVPTGNTKLVLTTIQCLLAPPFVVWAATDFGLTESLLSIGLGLVVSIVVLSCSLRARRVGGQWYSSSTMALFGLGRCFLGFVVSIAWISTIVNEVVALLQAMGLICGLSEALVGLTIFAAGNSLADLVANVTISRAGYPLMAISACFAGPLLNLLLGIGLSGSYLLGGHDHGHSSGDTISNGTYHFEISPTLLSSGAGLLVLLVGTLIAAPMQGFVLGRKMGWTLVFAYVTIMTINVTVEVWYAHKSGKPVVHG
ncbi:unnamed protein product [Jaminaea pallidilutea]